MSLRHKNFWRYVRGLAAPILLWTLFVAVLIEPLQSWLKGDERYDESGMREWVEEARPFRETLAQMARDFLSELDQLRQQPTNSDPMKDVEMVIRRERIREHLRSLGDPTKMYSGQLPFFPIIYRVAVDFELEPGGLPLSIVWDSHLTRHSSQYHQLDHRIDPRVWVRVQYQLHAYNKRQEIEQANAQRLRWISVLAVAGTAVALLWIYLVQQRERERVKHRVQTQQQIDQAERRRLEEELRRREAERRHEDTDRKLLEQRLATQAAERQALELKSQLYASIGIMAGSYAHNIKNLLVRPNDLLRRCLEADSLSTDQEHMLGEVRHTLSTVTERLQQILRTVRRDPSRSEMTEVDLNAVVRDLQSTWEDLAREKWKITLTAATCAEPLWIAGDLSHLQQAVENLLFNARDATFEMRNQLRDLARHRGDLSDEERRQSLIAAAAWRGTVELRTRRQGDHGVLEVQDNGIGMSEEVRRRCTETHFSTKRDNAIYEGNSTGMGLGLSFTVVILEHHQAKLETESEPGKGALFRASFALVPGRA